VVLAQETAPHTREPKAKTSRKEKVNRKECFTTGISPRIGPSNPLPGGELPELALTYIAQNLLAASSQFHPAIPRMGDYEEVSRLALDLEALPQSSFTQSLRQEPNDFPIFYEGFRPVRTSLEGLS
jgi:hypothetical protein